MSGLIKRITIVGGGSAGWLTAGILAAEYCSSSDTQIEITLVESPDVKTIGVGEGTWPTMRTTLDKMGISEAEFVRECSASFKQGSKFVGWKDGSEGDIYYHPFTLPSGYSDSNLAYAWSSAYSNIPFAEAVCLQGVACDQGRAPKLKTSPEFGGALNYGYHLDAGKFAMLLQKHCTTKLKVKHIQDHVVRVNSSPNGDIASLSTTNSGDIEGDLFVDCSGSTSLLLGQYYQIPYEGKKQFSANDTALAVQVPYADEDSAIASATIATAQSAGWTWDIGLSSRRGVGYVYSSAHISDDHAERELKKYLAKSIGEKNADAVSPRKIMIEPGHRKEFWHKNCVAIGMAAGFIEPLEASALALVELSANMIRNELPAHRSAMSIIGKRFNEIFHYRWKRIVEFLRLHYVLTQRRDTDYWCDMSRPEMAPLELQEQLILWQNRPPALNDFIQIEEIFPSASYQYVLYGMGFQPNPHGIIKTADHIDIGLMNIKENLEKTRKYCMALPSNRELLDHIDKYGLQKI